MARRRLVEWASGIKIFDANLPQGYTHASNPTAIPLGGSLYRVFYGARDESNRSIVRAFDFDVEEITVVGHLPGNVFDALKPGSYYQDGVGLGGAVLENDLWVIYFMGWRNPGGKQHWRGEIGRLELDVGLQKGVVKETDPAIGISEFDPVSLSYPGFLQLSESDLQMWYGTTISWDAGNGEMLHVLRKCVRSRKGTWEPQELALSHSIGSMQAFSRPTFLVSDLDHVEMYFSYRGSSPDRYKIGRAVSTDRGSSWSEPEPVANLASGLSWDSDMQEYPFVFVHNGNPFMLYNGNKYGFSGIGLSVGTH